MLKIDSCFAGGFWLKNFKWRDFHDDLWSNFCQKGKVSTGKAESCFRKRKFHPLFCFGHLMLTQTDLIFWTSRKRCNFSEMWRIHTTRYSVIFQKFPSRVRVVQKNPSSIRVAGTRWALLVSLTDVRGEVTNGVKAADSRSLTMQRVINWLWCSFDTSYTLSEIFNTSSSSPPPRHESNLNPILFCQRKWPRMSAR